MPEKYFIPATWAATALDRTLLPALEIEAPCEVTFATSASVFERLVRGETLEQIGYHNANVVTGPLFVRSAMPGDVLRIEVTDVRIESAWSVWIPGLGPLGGRTDSLQIRQVPLDGGFAQINDRVRVPVRPMVGVVGLAPAEGQGSTFHPAYAWGGNMDLRELSPGRAILHLPVQVPGAFLFVGDLHAAMGVAEPTHVALESHGTATVRVSVVKDMPLAFPRLRDGQSTLFVGVSDSFDESKRLAMDQVYHHLTVELGLSPFDAYAYASASVSLRLGGPASAIVIAELPDPGI